jgi:DNA-binding CsgD family transcriptional regulator
LSDKELEILRLIGKGYRTHEIARMLLISERTVETHRVHLRQKLNLRGAKDLLQYAIRWNQAGAS